MKRLLSGLRNFNAIGLALLTLAVLPINGMRREQPDLPLDEKSLRQIFAYQANNSMEYLKNIHNIANILWAQNYAANLVKDNVDSLVKLRPSNSEKFAEKITVKDMRNSFVSFIKENNTITTPEGIAFMLNVANMDANSHNEPVDWDSIEKATFDEHPEISKISRFYLSYRPTRDVLNDGIEAQATIQICAYIFLTNNIPFKKLEPLQKYMDNFLHFAELCKKEGLLNLSDKLRTSSTIHQLQSITRPFDTNPVFALEKFDTHVKLCREYPAIKNSCNELYKTIRKEINIMMLKNRHLPNMQQFKLIYCNPDSEELLPDQLESGEPSIPMTAKVPEIETPQIAKSVVAITKKGKKGAKKQIKTVKSNKSLTAPIATLVVESPVAKPDALVAKKSAGQNYIKDINDPMNSLSIHLYCSCKQKKDIPVFAHHSRIMQWFKDSKAALAIQGYLDPQNPKHKFIDTAIAYHAFSLDVDSIALKFGTQYEQVNKDGKRTLFIALPGHVEKNGQRIFGIFGYAIDPVEKICYHRCFEPRTTRELLSEYLNEETWKVTLEDLAEA